MRRWGILAALLLVPPAFAASLSTPRTPTSGLPQAAAVASPQHAAQRPDPTPLPGGGTKVFDRKRFLVAYYGTANTGVLGVLGETSVDQAHQRLMTAARPFARKGEQILPVYELIVTVADAHPGDDGDFSHDIDHRWVQPYIDAAHRHKALLLLDLQTGTSDFLTVAKRWQWALKDPWVGLALDPEWRMKRGQVPGQVIGSVRAAEVNRVSAWLDTLTRTSNLPEKVLMLHTFRTDMLPDIARVKDRPHLAEVLHVDGYGSPAAKLTTYRTVARPRQFTMGFKLFYDEDLPRMTPAQVRAVRPAVRFVSFQ